MNDQPNFPSKPPSSDGDMGAMLTWVLRKFSQKFDTQLPAQVVSYDRATNRATVQPLIALVTTNGSTLNRATISEMPVLALGGGGFFINFPLQQGDLGWIEASDRDISRFMQSMQADAPNTKRMHSFEDGRFIPDVYGKYTGTPTAGAMVLSSLDGTTRMEIAPGSIKCYAADIQLNATTIECNAPSGIALNGPLTQGKDSSGVGYTAHLQGKLTVDIDIAVAAIISLIAHTHHVNSTPGESNAPTPGT